MIFRSIETELPRELLGWDYGTLEITSAIQSKNISPELQNLRIKLRTSVNRGKLHFSGLDEGVSNWKGKQDRSIRLAVRKRYCSCVMIEFRKSSFAFDKTPAFAVLWLKDIADEDERDLTLPIWRNDGRNKARAEANCDTGSLGEQQMGEIVVPVKFHRGLGAYHGRLASASQDLQDILEVLSTANDNQEADASSQTEESDAESDASLDSSDEDDGKEDHGKAKGVLKKLGLALSDKDSDANPECNDEPTVQRKDDQMHSEQLQRRHRGIMQFKGARTAKWMKKKVEHGKNHMLDNLQYHDRSPGVETEV